MYDILIKGGKYPDFEAGTFIEGNVAINDGKIVAVGPVYSLANTLIGDIANVKEVK